MNKKLIALAVAGATVAPAAMAQTANPVTLSGRVHLTFESVESKNGLSKRTRVNDQASFVRISGTEDLGRGLKAFFALETGFAADQFPTVGGTTGITTAPAGTGFANRNSGIGFQGGWGSVIMGRWDTPFKVAAGSIDPFGDVTIAGYTVAMSDQGNFDRRDGNTVQYWSPNMGGFAFKALWQASEAKSATANPYDTSYSVTFSRGPVYLFATYEEHRDQLGSATGTPPHPVAAGAKEKGAAIGGSFAFGPLKIAGEVQEFKKTGRTKRSSWMANGVWTMGNNQLIYQFQKSEDGAARGAAQPECDSHAAGWQYNFSRRTFTQLIYVKTDNNAVATCGTQIGGGAGSDPRGISFGIRHVF